MNAALADATRATLAAQVAADLTWTHQSRHGRWMVVEPGISSDLRELPRDMRERIDARIPHRGRRFSSLSRARAFARLVGGHVERRGRRRWFSVSPWERVTGMGAIGSYVYLAKRTSQEVVP